eukprot:CAMPEP_0119348642 /NCGR_PEP_ID=MMETSP1333-20130426/109150_1 /TAXON_ID=418940 /ORGANISM="Scyphosphaera apsteinii, Strain RCC1455" /LENGTH=160 /DNA_ID=CAMNT_0007361233 /DNA_START=628 /DNA_END=1110 /DNA_ORIENTATION=+
MKHLALKCKDLQSLIAKLSHIESLLVGAQAMRLMKLTCLVAFFANDETEAQLARTEDLHAIVVHITYIKIVPGNRNTLGLDQLALVDAMSAGNACTTAITNTQFHYLMVQGVGDEHMLAEPITCNAHRTSQLKSRAHHTVGDSFQAILLPNHQSQCTSIR